MQGVFQGTTKCFTAFFSLLPPFFLSFFLSHSPLFSPPPSFFLFSSSSILFTVFFFLLPLFYSFFPQYLFHCLPPLLSPPPFSTFPPLFCFSSPLFTFFSPFHTFTPLLFLLLFGFFSFLRQSGHKKLKCIGQQKDSENLQHNPYWITPYFSVISEGLSFIF